MLILMESGVQPVHGGIALVAETYFIRPHCVANHVVIHFPVIAGGVLHEKIVKSYA